MIFKPNDRYLLVDDRSGPLFPISQGMLPWQPIMGKIGKMTFIRQAGVPKQIGISQLRFKNIHWQYCIYILCKFDQIGPITPDITRVTTAPAWMRRQKLAYPTDYLSNY